MSRSSGTGQPHHFQCSACRRAKHWDSRKDPEGWGKGGLTHVQLTGLSKAVNDGRANGRSANTRFQYKCLDCGHVGWSRHFTVLARARREGIPTPGEE